MKRKKLTLLLGILLISKFTFSQTVHENTGWFAWFNSYKFSDRWGLFFDGQLRSADDLEYSRTLLLRPGLIYYLNKKSNVTLGYGLVSTFRRIDGVSADALVEHRIWQQYIYTHKIEKVFMQHRFRLEQRFIERPADHIFSQRLRYFARGIIPLVKYSDAFGKGMYTALQDELFFNLQNKSQLNDNFFDQNRAYVAIGYRFSPKVDMEAGYMNQYIKGLSNNTSNNIIQLALYTRF